MVENIQTKTKTQTAVGFKDNERLFGFDAMQKKARFPKQVFSYMHDFLGKSIKDNDVKKFMENYFISYDMQDNNDTSTIEFKVNFNGVATTFRTEEIYGMIFRYIKYLADKFSNDNIRDCVITVPAFFGYKEKAALENAVEMTGLNLLAFVNENVAGAVHYFLDKKINVTQNMIFYNMGSSYTQAALIHFSNDIEDNIEHKRINVLKNIIKFFIGFS